MPSIALGPLLNRIPERRRAFSRNKGRVKGSAEESSQMPPCRLQIASPRAVACQNNMAGVQERKTTCLLSVLVVSAASPRLATEIDLGDLCFSGRVLWWLWPRLSADRLNSI
jgi:hypothetical protein